MKFLYITLFLMISFASFSQEILTGLQENPVVKEKALEFSKYKAQVSDTLPVMLPFRDDFSEQSVFPSPARWIDRYAYVNNDYPVYPVDLGVVTLDAINDSGKFYPEAIPGPLTFIADHLTSRFIRLDSIFTPVPHQLTPADSVYLSFYYQPQGRGISLSTSDSLVLEFFVRPAYDTIIHGDTVHKEDQWKQVWSSEGFDLDTFYIRNNAWFKRVMIPVTNPAYFKKDFSFRFYNRVSLASIGQPSWQSNGDFWNIDEVYMNAGRSKGDTIFPEIRFLDTPPPFLKQYTSMPYRQYSDDPGGEMVTDTAISITNRDIISHPVVYRYTVTQPGGSFFHAYQQPEFLLPSYTSSNFGYNDRVPVNFSFPISNADSTLFAITHIIRESSPGSTLGDTIETYQRFYNYYSYDDGTPELGYGLKGAGAFLAYQFKLNVSPDTLRAIRIYFNRTLTSANQQYFYLTVWNDNNGKPGDTIYSRNVYVNFTDSLNNFYTYNLDNPVRITGTFYIGTIQSTDNNLNIGFDANNNSQSHIFFNATGTWQTSVMGGSLMIRPVIGKPLPLGINDNLTMAPGSISVWPNPCSTGKIKISLRSQRLSETEGWKIIISNVTGLRLMELPYSETIDVTGISSGMYILTMINQETSERYSSKLIITR